MLKPAVAKALNSLLAPIQKAYDASPEWQEITKNAYPPPPSEEKKKKKPKDKGSKYPSGPTKGVEAKPDGHIEGKRSDEVNLATGAEEAMGNLEVNGKKAEK